MKYSEHIAEKKAEKEKAEKMNEELFGDNRLKNEVLKKSVITAVKNIFGNFKEYYSFFVALFIIQTLFWMLLINTCSNIDRETEFINKRYNYDLLVENIDDNTYSIMINKMGILKFEDERCCFSDYKIIHPSVYCDTYGIELVLKEGYTPESFVNSFVTGLNIDPATLQITPMPVVTMTQVYVASIIKNSIFLSIALTILSSLLLMSLYNVRLNHYKFLYGIYMTCGAGYKRLFGNAITEIMIVSFTTLAPSFLLSMIIGFLLYGSYTSIRFWMIPALLVLNILTVFISVKLPVKSLSKKTPISLIVAQDNSNLVTSPKRSFRIFNKSFPLHYELFSTWRFRKYLASTLATAIVFTSLFICGIYIADMSEINEKTYDPEYTIAFDLSDVTTNTEDTDDSFNVKDIVDIMNDLTEDGIDKIKGVAYTDWNNNSSATSLLSHIMLKRENVTAGMNYTLSYNLVPEYDQATNYVEYKAIDEHYINTISKKYHITGDPYSIIDDPTKIIITDTLYNKKCFSFSPGDRIIISAFLRGKMNYDFLQSMDLTDILKFQLTNETFLFDDKEYEIAAVIHDVEAEDRLLVGMNYDEYYKFTGSKNINNELMIYLDENVDSKNSESILTDIREQLYDYVKPYMIDYKVVRSFNALNNEVISGRNTYSYIIIVSLLLLLLSPVVWFFSQTQFYYKREKEINLLRMFGTNEKKVKGVYYVAASISAITGILASVLIGITCNALLYKLFNGFLQKYGFIKSERYTLTISTAGLLICVMISAASGFLSSYIPYNSCKKHLKKESSRQLSGEN